MKQANLLFLKINLAHLRQSFHWKSQPAPLYMHFIKCPVKGKFEGKEFVMIFKTDYHHSDEIHTITLFPNW
jgi:hypothetical protein